MKKYGMKKRLMLIFPALLLAALVAGCTQETQRGEITLPEAELPAAEETEAE